MRRPSLLFMIPMAICTLVLVVALLPMSFAHLQPVHAAPTKLSNTSSTGRYHSMKTRHAVTFNTAALNLQYNGGPTMRTTSTNYLIFWEPATLQDGTPTYVSPTYNSLIEQYFNDSGGSSLYNNNTQYYDTTGHILNNSSIGGVWIDTSPYPPSGCNDSATPHGCLSGKQIVNEVKKAISTNNWTVDTTHMFFFFSSWGEGSCHGDCAFTNYCAYHATFTTSSNQAAIFANIPYTGTDLSACGVPQSPNGDFDADSSINITSHEHMEAVTDPLINAWFDPYGSR